MAGAAAPGFLAGGAAATGPCLPRSTTLPSDSPMCVRNTQTLKCPNVPMSKASLVVQCKQSVKPGLVISFDCLGWRHPTPAPHIDSCWGAGGGGGVAVRTGAVRCGCERSTNADGSQAATVTLVWSLCTCLCCTSGAHSLTTLLFSSAMCFNCTCPRLQAHNRTQHQSET